MANTWSAWYGHTTNFEYPFIDANLVTHTDSMLYKVNIDKRVLKLQFSASLTLQVKDPKKGWAHTYWSYYDCSMEAKINFYDKYKNKISDSVIVNNHCIYDGGKSSQGGRAENLWDNNNLCYYYNVTRYVNVPSAASSYNSGSVGSYLLSHGFTCSFGDTWLMGEPFIKRFIQDSCSERVFAPRPRSQAHVSPSYWIPSRINKDPITILVNIPKGAAFFNVTIYGTLDDGKTIKTFPPYTFPDIGEASVNDNFLLDPYSKAYIKNGSWQDEPYYWYKSNASSGHDDGKGWDKTFAYYKNSSNWTEI